MTFTLETSLEVCDILLACVVDISCSLSISCAFSNVRSLPLLTMFFAYFRVLNSNNKTVSHHIICFLIIAFLHHKLQIGNKLISSFSFCLKMDMKFISVIYWQKFPTPHIYFNIIYKTLTLIYTSKPLSTSI